MTVEEFWTRISVFVESAPFCCSLCPVAKYTNYETGCEKGCAFALAKLYDELCKGKVKVGDEIYE